MFSLLYFSITIEIVWSIFIIVLVFILKEAIQFHLLLTIFIYFKGFKQRLGYIKHWEDLGVNMCLS